MAFYFSLYRGRETDVTLPVYSPRIYNLTLTRKDLELLSVSCAWGLWWMMKGRGAKYKIGSASVDLPT